MIGRDYTARFSAAGQTIGGSLTGKDNQRLCYVLELAVRDPLHLAGFSCGAPNDAYLSIALYAEA